jgi:exosome complex component RRP43
LYRSELVPLSRLLIEPAKAAWVLYVDVVCINHGGNILDAAVLAVVAALRNSAFVSSLFVLLAVKLRPRENSTITQGTV